MMVYKRFLLPLLLVLIFPEAFAQTTAKAGKGDVYVDGHGVMRWTKDQREAAFFGVNYTVPFAYGYRSVKAKHIDLETEIRQDVYHFSRLGLDAFRIHVWDTEISDSLGNLKQNEHLRLFDFLLAELKKRHIKIIITPIAFWGNGYPDKDENTGSFSAKYGKERALREEPAFLAQENYLKQFFNHKNPYTGLTYGQDNDVIATEVNNEPHHSGPKERTTEYINRMVKAIRGTGWTKPVFYNISESPAYADAVVKADVQGHSFQWYPTGLVSGHTLKGNYLPNVSAYVIPFDSIPGFNNRAKMVYEFDAADLLSSYMYPAIAKSFRAAGFQWATQFAYDPLATAYANTEYQTHYLNLAYTPSKAISLLIASKAFHQLPRLKKDYSSDTLFNGFKVSYARNLSELNTASEFYYSNTTQTKPVDDSKLQHAAGVGSSVIVKYTGTGIYFIDKIYDGVWRLEVMPDVTHINDPFEKTSLEKEVTHLSWNTQSIELNLSNLGNDFSIKAINDGNTYSAKVIRNSFKIRPGTYLLVKKGLQTKLTASSTYGLIKLGEFVAPKESTNDSATQYTDYRQVSKEALIKSAVLEIFNPARDKTKLIVYNPDWKNNKLDYISKDNVLNVENVVNDKNVKEQSSQQILKMSIDTLRSNSLFGWQCYIDKIPAGSAGLKTLYIRARTTDTDPIQLKIGLISTKADFFSASVTVGPQFKDIEIPLSSLQADAQLLLPRPYPGFLPLYFHAANRSPFNLGDVEKVELRFGANSKQLNHSSSLEIESIYIK